MKERCDGGLTYRIYVDLNYIVIIMAESIYMVLMLLVLVLW